MFPQALLIALALSTPVQEKQWFWKDLEIVGYRTFTRDQIAEHIPLELGSPFAYDSAAVAGWADQLKKTLGLAEARIRAVRFADGDAFLVVDVIEKGDEERLEFRAPPKGNVPFPEDVAPIMDRLDTLQQSLFNQGRPSAEFVRDGTLDYQHDGLHALVEELRAVVPAHRETLIQIVGQDRNARSRARAATALNWAREVEDSIRRVHVYADDADVGVRNNVTRFMLHYVQNVQSSETRRAIIETMAKQISRPSHADRNKGIYALLHLAQSNEDDIETIFEVAEEWILLIAEQSLLSNVQGPAQELLDLEDA